MSRIVAIAILLLAAASADADQRSIVLRHRAGGGGGGESADYALGAWAWLDFLSGSTMYKDADATIVASAGDSVLVVRDKIRGTIFTNQNAAAVWQYKVQPGGGIYNDVGRGHINSTIPLFEDSAAVGTSNYCAVWVMDVQSRRTSTRAVAICDASGTPDGFGNAYVNEASMLIATGSRNLPLTNTILGLPLGVHVFALTREHTSGKYGVCSYRIDGANVASGTQDIAVGSTFKPGIGSTSYAQVDGVWLEVLFFDDLPEDLSEIEASLASKYGIGGM